MFGFTRVIDPAKTNLFWLSKRLSRRIRTYSMRNGFSLLIKDLYGNDWSKILWHCPFNMTKLQNRIRRAVSEERNFVFMYCFCLVSVLRIRDSVLFYPRDPDPGWIFSGSRIQRVRYFLCTVQIRDENCWDPGSGIKHPGYATLPKGHPSLKFLYGYGIELAEFEHVI
jgi:hypothetical protein